MNYVGIIYTHDQWLSYPTQTQPTDIHICAELSTRMQNFPMYAIEALLQPNSIFITLINCVIPRQVWPTVMLQTHQQTKRLYLLLIFVQYFGFV